MAIKKEHSATKIKGELRAILWLCWTALKTNRCKKMRIYNTALKLARFIHIVMEKCIKFPALPGIFWNFWRRPEVTAHYKKIPPLYLRKNLLATAGNLKVNEQTKYKSNKLFLAIERKPEIQNY